MKKERKWPKKHTITCNECGRPKTYIRTQKAHILQFCSERCRRKNRARTSESRKLRSAKIKKQTEVMTFERGKICLRKTLSCKHYAECVDERLDGKLSKRYLNRYECKNEDCFEQAEEVFDNLKCSYSTHHITPWRR